MRPSHANRRRTRALVTALVLVLALAGGVRLALPWLGHLLIEDSGPEAGDAAVVLSTGVDYFPRLMEAAALVRTGRVGTVVINGNRKTEILRELEALGFQRSVPWDEDAKRILELLGVARAQVVAISAEDAYDTISEARLVGAELARRDWRRLVLVTSRFHTRRAARIWRGLYGARWEIVVAPATRDPFDPDGWWRDGRQIRQLLAEYGGWLVWLGTDPGRRLPPAQPEGAALRQ